MLTDASGGAVSTFVYLLSAACLEQALFVMADVATSKQLSTGVFPLSKQDFTKLKCYRSENVTGVAQVL